MTIHRGVNMGTRFSYGHWAGLVCIVFMLSSCNGSDDPAPVTKTESEPQALNLSIYNGSNNPIAVGQVLVGDYYFDTGAGGTEGDSTYRWLRNSNSTGETTQFHPIVAADDGQTLVFEVTPVSSSGLVGAPSQTNYNVSLGNSTPVATNVQIMDRTPNMGAEAIAVGDTLEGTYDYSDTETDLQNGSLYQWTRGNNPIPSATSKTYTLAVADLGEIIGFEVRPATSSGSSPGNTASATVLGGNMHPIAVDDTINIPEIQPSLAITTLLVNDTDPGGVDDNGDGILDNLVLTRFDSTGTIGSAILDDSRGGRYFLNQQFEYLALGESATDTFQYTMSDGNGGYDTAIVTINIAGVNDRPLPENDVATFAETGPGNVIDVLANDTDVDANDDLIISNVDLTINSTLGSVTISLDGKSIFYDPNGQFNLMPGETAIDEFVYEINDQRGVNLNTSGSNIGYISTNTATVTVTITGQ